MYFTFTLFHFIIFLYLTSGVVVLDRTLSIPFLVSDLTWLNTAISLSIKVTKSYEIRQFQRPIRLFLSSQATSSSPRPSTCRRTTSWSSPTTGRRCFPPTSPTARPPAPTTTWASSATTRCPGSTRSRIRTSGERVAPPFAAALRELLMNGTGCRFRLLCFCL